MENTRCPLNMAESQFNRASIEAEMTEQYFEKEKKSSYSHSQQRIHNDLNLQEHAYARLNALFQISKLLSTFLSDEETFPQILTVVSKTFPLLTAVLVDDWEKKTKTAIWHSDSAVHEQVVSATLNAREAFGYLAGSTVLESDDLKTDTASMTEFSGPDDKQILSEGHLD